MLKSITFRADEELIKAARERAQGENSTLSAEFRRWLEQYAGRRERAARYLALMEDLQTRVSTSGRKFTRDEMNERR